MRAEKKERPAGWAGLVLRLKRSLHDGRYKRRARVGCQAGLRK